MPVSSIKLLPSPVPLCASLATSLRESVHSQVKSSCSLCPRQARLSYSGPAVFTEGGFCLNLD